MHALLIAHEGRGQLEFLSSPLASPAERPCSIAGAGERSLPEFVGPYRLIESLGGGGMGSVWLAEQEQPIARKVALKIVLSSVVEDGGRLMFEFERQVLAQMDSPAIARILDVGSLDDGRPWFAMEFVQGKPIDQWYAKNPTVLDDRLEHFLQVCGAVEHAHCRGVVHLDIKPSNVLVREVDGRVEAKLIDFGIAQALGRGSGERGDGAAGHWGSPGTMSPEQAKRDGIGPDVRSDIYSLGLLLHVVLTGRPARRTEAMDKLEFTELTPYLERAGACRPSVDLGDGATLAEQAERLGLSAPKLLRTLRTELDWIVAKATRLDADERYPTVASLADDVRRFLGDEPVAAVPKSSAYRLRTGFRRHRLGVLAALVTVVALIGGAVLATLGWMTARQERNVAWEASTRARQLAEFLVGTLRLADPRASLDANMSMRELLDMTAVRLENALDPRSEAQVRATIGEAYRSLGLDPIAREHLRKAVRVLQDHGGESPLELYRAAWGLFLLSETSESRAAMELMIPVLNLRTRLLETFDPVLAQSLASLGSLDAQPFEAGLAELPEVLAAAEVRNTDDAPLWFVVADTLADLGLVLARDGGDERALVVLRHAKEILRTRLPEGHPDLTRIEFLRASVWADAGRFGEAVRALRAVVDVQERTLPEGHRRLLEARSLLGECLVERGHEREGLEFLAGAAEELLQGLGPIAAATIDAQLRLLDASHRAASPSPRVGERMELQRLLADRPFGVLRWRLRPALLGAPDDPLRSATAELLAACTGWTGPKDPDAAHVALARVIDLVEAASGDDPRSILLARLLVDTATSLPFDQMRLRTELVRAALNLVDSWPDSLVVRYADALMVLGVAVTSKGSPYPENSEQVREARGIYARELGSNSASTLRADRLLASTRERWAGGESEVGPSAYQQWDIHPEDADRVDYLP